VRLNDIKKLLIFSMILAIFMMLPRFSMPVPVARKLTKKGPTIRRAFLAPGARTET
jgi:hypothetical protein